MKNNLEEKIERNIVSSGMSEKDREFSNLIQNEYREEFQKLFDSRFGKRFKRMKETEEELSKIKSQIKPLMEYYKTGDAEVLVSLILKDLEKKVFSREEEKKEEMPLEKWIEEAFETSKIYPEFEFTEELKNPAFIKGLKAGIPMTSIYRALHFDDISKGISETAMKAALENIRAGKGRTNELGMENLGSVRAKKKADTLTEKEIEEILKKVKKGERVSFAE